MVAEDKSLWVEALDELVKRRSVRAYCHVRNRMFAGYGEEAAVAEEANWSAGWGGNQLRQQERDDHGLRHRKDDGGDWILKQML